MKFLSTDRFLKLYGAAPDAAAFAPGRVNLIGEHTDYNGGLVLPCALSMGVACAVRRRTDGRFFFYSESFAGVGAVEGSPESVAHISGWHKYPCAVLKSFLDAGCVFDFGADFYFCGDLPYGAGLSSSAALEVSCAFVVNALYGFQKDAKELAQLAWYAENRLIGVGCGIMDQFASALSKDACALLLNAATREYSYENAYLDGYGFLVINSGVKHQLSSGGYKDRKRECEAARKALDTALPTPCLCARTLQELEEHKGVFSDPVLYRRARHVISENARVNAAAQALKEKDACRFGELMNRSHASQRDDFEVSCAEVDFLVGFAQGFDGVLGARLTGGGFGGCTVNLVRKSRIEAFAAAIKKAYDAAFGLKAQIHPVIPSGGAHEIETGF